MKLILTLLLPLIFIKGVSQNLRIDIPVNEFIIPGNDSISIMLPPSCIVIQKWYYGEGMLISIRDTVNNGTICIHWGGNINLPFIKEDKNHTITDSVKLNGRIIRKGTYEEKKGIIKPRITSKFWREDNYWWYNVYFYSDEKDKILFEYILDDFGNRNSSVLNKN